MNTIQRYIVGSFLSAFFLAWLVLTFVLSTALLAKVTSLIAQGMPASIIGRYFLLCIPETMGFTIPLAVLIGGLLVFGRLSADSEIAAMRACGINLISIIAWPLAIALAMSGVAFYIHNEISPKSDEIQTYLRAEARANLGLGLDAMEPGTFNSLPGDMSICFTRRNGDWLSDVLIFNKTKTGVLRETRATRMHVIQQGNDLLLDLYDAWVDPIDETQPGAAKAERFGYKILDAFKPTNHPWPKIRNYDFNGLRQALDEATRMSATPQGAMVIIRKCPNCNRLDPRTHQPICVDPVHRLAREWADLSPLYESAAAQPNATTANLPSVDNDPSHARMQLALATHQRVMALPVELKVELHKRLALSCAAFCFALIGMPLGIRAHRRESTIGVAIGLIIALVFYMAIILAESIKNPAVHPEWIPWIPVAVCIAVAAVLIPKNQ